MFIKIFAKHKKLIKKYKKRMVGGAIDISEAVNTNLQKK